MTGGMRSKHVCQYMYINTWYGQRLRYFHTCGGALTGAASMSALSLVTAALALFRRDSKCSVSLRRAASLSRESSRLIYPR